MAFSPLLTDLYQLTMARAYWESGNADTIGTFELFFRRCPFKGEYAVVAGHDLVQEILEKFQFTDEDVEYLRSLESFKGASEAFFKAIRNLNLKDVEVLGIEEGDLAFARLPILQVRGPILKIQLLESALLNAVNFATLVATYSRRMRMIAPKKRLLEFGMRRAQGPNGALTASRSSYLGGFDATTNVLASKIFKLPVVGTMAHSFVQSFREFRKEDLDWNGKNIGSSLEAAKKEDGLEANDGELAAFLAYAKVFPDQASFLVDTYDVLKSGVPNAIRVFKVLKKLGHKGTGIRLDSGDLVYFSKESRKLLDDAGFKDIPIMASNELDENIIESLQDQGAVIDAYGVGTQLVVSAEQPALGGVYKLVEFDGHPRMKISEQTEKIVLPCTKQVYRLYGKQGEMLLDLMCGFKETPPKPGKEILALHPIDLYKRALVVPSEVRPLLKSLFKCGKWMESKTLEEKRTLSMERMKSLRSDISRRHNPAPYKVSLSSHLKSMVDELYMHEKPPMHLE